MAQLNVRLDDHTRELLDALAQARGVNASDLVRTLINDALGRSRPGRSDADITPQSLSPIQRQILSLQHEILAHLTAPDDATERGWGHEQNLRMIDVLESGFTAEYSEMFQTLSPELTERECILVHDIFEMFRTVRPSFQALTPKERASLGEHAGHALEFRGFDFNDRQEARLANYARYLVKNGRWNALSEHFDAKHEHGNSHSPKLATYQRMLNVWRPIWSQKLANMNGDYLLTVEELQTIMNAWPYPQSDFD